MTVIHVQGSKLREQFKSYDKDNNGRIDLSEMTSLLSDLGLRLSQQQVGPMPPAVANTSTPSA